jgi:hypothetical protein
MTGSRGFEGQFRSRVPGADNQNVTRRELRGVLVRAGTNLDDRLAQAVGPGRHVCGLVGSSRDDDLIGFEAGVARFDRISTAAAFERDGFRAEAYRQFHSARVLFKVIRHVVFAGKRVLIAGEGQSRKARVLRRGEQPQRVPPCSPRLADPAPSLQNQHVDACLEEIVTDSESGLAGADDDHLKLCSRVSAFGRCVSIPLRVQHDARASCPAIYDRKRWRRVARA